VADKKTILNVAYKDSKTHICFAKRFIVTKFILDKIYPYMEEGMELQYISTSQNPVLELQLIPKVNQKQSKVEFNFANLAVKGVTSKGIRMDKRPIKKIVLLKSESKA